jgi:hypothetical protein
MVVPYIARSQTESFLADVQTALQQPQDSPLVFQGLSEHIDLPIPLIATLMEQVNQKSKSDWEDEFTTRYKAYRTAIEAIETQPVEGKLPNNLEAVQAIAKAGTSGDNVLHKDCHG